MDLKNPRFLWSPGAVVLLKIGSSQPDTLFTGKHLQSMSIDGPGTLQSSMCHTLKHKIRHGPFISILISMAGIQKSTPWLIQMPDGN